MPPISRVMRALYDYDAQQEDELSFRENDLLCVLPDLDGPDPDWFRCALKAQDGGDDQIGACPANYLEDAQPRYRAAALYDYAPGNEDELELHEQDLVDVLEETADGWLIVCMAAGDGSALYGLIPANYVEQVASNAGEAISPTAAAAASAAAAGAAAAAPEPVPSTPPPAAAPSPPPAIPTPPPQSAISMRSETPSVKAPPPILAPSPALVNNVVQAAPTTVGGQPKVATALYDFDPQEPDDLDLREGENCLVLEDTDPQWIRVRIISTRPDRLNKEGFVPRDYLQVKEIGRSGTPASAAALAAPASPAPAATPAVPPPMAPKPASIPSPTASVTSGPPPALPSRPDPVGGIAAAAAAAARAQPPVSPALPPRPASASHGPAAPAPPEPGRSASPGLLLPTQPATPGMKITLPTRPANGGKGPGTPVTQQSAASAQKDMPDPTKVRIWLDQSGLHKTEAAYVDFIDGKVKLHKTSGLKIDVPISALANDDQVLAYNLKGLPVPPHLAASKAPPPGPLPPRHSIGSAAAAPAVAAAAARAVMNGPAIPTGVTVYNGFDWLSYLEGCGVDAVDARPYACRFASEKLDSTVLPDLNRDILKGLDVKEGDLLRILKHTSSLAKAQEREAEMAAKNLERIEQYFSERVRVSESSQPSQFAGLGNGMGAGSSSFDGISGGNRSSSLSKADQLKSDEEFARRLQEEEMRAAGKKVPPPMVPRSAGSGAAASSSTSARSGTSSTRPRPERKPAATPPGVHPGAASAGRKSRPHTEEDPLAGLLAMAAAPVQRPASALAASGPRQTPIVPPARMSTPSGQSMGMMSNSSSSSLPLAGGIMPSLQPQPQLQPQRALPAPLISAQSVSSGFTPTKVSMNPTGAVGMGGNMMNPQQAQFGMIQQQQQQQQQLQQQQQAMAGMMGYQGSPGMQRRMMTGSPGMGGPVGMNMTGMVPTSGPVTVSSTGRGANWQNATPDNPFGKAMGAAPTASAATWSQATSTGSSMAGMGAMGGGMGSMGSTVSTNPTGASGMGMGGMNMGGGGGMGMMNGAPAGGMGMGMGMGMGVQSTSGAMMQQPMMTGMPQQQQQQMMQQGGQVPGYGLPMSSQAHMMPGSMNNSQFNYMGGMR